MRIKNSYGQKTAGYFLRGMAAVFAAAVVSLCSPSVSLADFAGTVTVESAKIRGSADPDSDVVGSASKGAKVTIKDEVQDASGTLWYQVFVDANTMGYVRADLIDKEGGDDGSAAQASPEGGTENAGQDDAGQEPPGASSQAESAMDAQYASVSVETAKIRSGPSTNDSIVERLAKDTQVTVSGQSNGSSDGKVWYYITFTGADGTQKSGFIRSDLIVLGDMVPVPEEQLEPEAQPEPEVQEPVSQDYEVVFRDGKWYLLDNIGGYEQELQPLLDANQLQKDTMEEDAKKLVRQRIAIVVLGVLAVILLIVVIVMAVKLRDAYYEDYEDDEEDEDGEEDEEDGGEEEEPDDEEEPVRRRRRREEEENQQPPRGTMREKQPPVRRPVRESEARGGQAAETRVRPAEKRKAKNFLVDDDDFEFEFLNMDNKDL